MGQTCASKMSSSMCIPMDKKPEVLCDTTDPHSPCWSLVSTVQAATHEWVLIVTSSGGGGHLTAARNLAKVHTQELSESIEAASEALETGRDLLAPETYAQLAASIAHVRNSPPPLEIVDLMHSPCTNLFGRAGLPLGNWMTEKWNRAQRAGNIHKIRDLISQQWLMQPIFGHHCTHFFTRVLGGKVYGHQGPPTTTISSQPLLLQSIVQAQELVNNLDADSPEMTVDLYMTDLPTEQCVAFFGSLQHLSQHHPEISSRVVVHTVAPASGGAAEIARLSGLNTSQVVIEKFMPVTADFTSPTGLPRPGTATSITIHANSPTEERFLHGEEATYNIAAEDQLMLVMLGSQPTVAEMEEYQNQATFIQPRGAGIFWVFMACGKPTVPAYEALYERSAAAALQFNTMQERSGGKLRIIPFTAQPAGVLEGRADVTVTRSGGMTCGELLALGSRGDNRKVLVHVEVPQTMSPVAPVDAVGRREWENLVLEAGMVPWEAGNARHMMEELDAEIVTAKMLLRRLE